MAFLNGVSWWGVVGVDLSGWAFCFKGVLPSKADNFFSEVSYFQRPSSTRGLCPPASTMTDYDLYYDLFNVCSISLRLILYSLKRFALGWENVSMEVPADLYSLVSHTAAVESWAAEDRV